MSRFSAPIIERGELEQACQDWRDSGETIVFTNGCFDILHVGHLQTLTAARSEGSKLLVGLNSDRSVRALKGPTRPINAEADRAQILASLRCVDAVTIFDEDTPIEALDLIRPHIHVKGGDYKVEDLSEADVVKKHGGRIVIVGLVPGHSTTSTIEKTRSK